MSDHIRISGLGIEIYKNDIPGVRWNKAQTFAEFLKDGWRLPTLKELALIKTLRDVGGIGRFPVEYSDFSDSYYWSGKEGEATTLRTQLKDGSSSYAYYFDVAKGISSHSKKAYDLRVRFVRDI